VETVNDGGKVDVLKKNVYHCKLRKGSLIRVYLADDVGDELMLVLANISEVPVKNSAADSDDPFSRFISLRNLAAAATAPVNSSSMNSASLRGQRQHSQTRTQTVLSVLLIFYILKVFVNFLLCFYALE